MLNKSIIAMKGHPFTRKTEFARIIAAELSCPLLSIHDFLEFLIPADETSNSCTPVPHPQDLAFQIICQTARTHLSFGVSQNVVIDSRLFSRSHLVIQLGKHDLLSSRVRRTTSTGGRRSSRVIIRGILIRRALANGMRPRIGKMLRSQSETVLMRDPMVMMCLSWYWIPFRSTKMLKLNQVGKLCSFVLHKQCAEFLDDDNVPLCGGELYYMYDPSGFRCRSCEGNNSNSCDECVFTSHVKSRLMPTIIRHGCDEHFLSVVMSRLNDNETYSICRACGDPVYKVWYSCKTCCVAYHHRCLTKVAHQVEHEHGEHHHHMLLQYTSKEAEDYICDVCFERERQRDRRDPCCWFYSCEVCPYVAHLRCTDDGKT